MCTVRRLVTLICLFLLSALAHADVDPSIILQMQPLSGATASSPRVDLIITVSVPVYAGNPESQLRVTVRGDAQARLAGADAWVVNSVVPGYTYTFRTATSVATARSGRVRVEATSYNAQGRSFGARPTSCT